MDLIVELFKSDLFQIIFKLVLSAFLAGVIGIERSSMSKPAGFGTHAIIGVSSALVVMAGCYMANYYEIDASRIPSQILTGIGFIGAGTIIRNGLNVRGVTTAAGILSVTCIGMAVGMGYYEAAVISTLIVFLILSINHGVANKFERYEALNLVITVDSNLNKTMEEIEDLFKKEKVTIGSIGKESDSLNGKKVEILKMSITYDVKRIDKTEIMSSLFKMKSISKVIEED